MLAERRQAMNIKLILSAGLIYTIKKTSVYSWPTLTLLILHYQNTDTNEPISSSLKG